MKWATVKLCEITNNLDSKRKPLNDQERTLISKNQLYPYIGANNVVGYVDEYLFDEEILCVAEDGGSWGKDQKCATIYNGKTWVNNHAHVLTPKNGTDIRYVMNYLNWADLNKFITGTTRGKLTKSALEKIEIPFPPLTVQKQIADTLDKADALRKKDQQLLQKYDELVQSIFYEMFGDPVQNERGWKTQPIKQVTKMVTYGLTVRPDYIDHGIPLISARELRRGFVDIDSAPKISREDFTRLSDKCKPRRGDVLFSKTGTIGLSAIVEDEVEFAVTQNAARIVFDSNILNLKFALSVLRNERFIKECNGLGKGNAVKDLQLGDFSRLLFIVPPRVLQDQFEQRLAVGVKLKEVQSRTCEQTSNLFNLLLNEYFS